MDTDKIKRNAGPMSAGAGLGAGAMYVLDKIPTDTAVGQIILGVVILAGIFSITLIQLKKPQ